MSICRYCLTTRLKNIPIILSSSYKKRYLSVQPPNDVLISRADEFSGEKVEIFHSADIQTVLKRMTGLHLDKVFPSRKEELSNPTFKVLDESELKEDEERVVLEAEKALEMPLLRKRRRRIDVVLHTDEIMKNFDPDVSNYIFTDISMSKHHRNRAVLVRESASGSLREASWDERDRMQYMYYPKEGQHHEIIPMLTDEHLERVLDDSRYEDVLDLINIQCETDAPDYIRVHERVYNHIADRNLFDVLKSTRYYGGMVFYFVNNNNIHPLLSHYLRNDSVNDAMDLVKLYLLVHSDAPLSQSLLDINDDHLLLLEYLRKEGLHQMLELVEENENRNIHG